MIQRRFIQACAISAACVVATALFVGWPIPSNVPHLPLALQSPMLAMEVACGRDGIDAVLKGQPGIVPVLQSSLARDPLLIVAYWLFFTACGVLQLRRRKPIIGVALIGCGIVAGLFDFAENSSIQSALLGVDSCPKTFTLWKWRFFFAAVFLLAPIYRRPNDSLVSAIVGWLALIATAFAALTGSCGAALDYPSLIEAGTQRFASALLIGLLYFASHRRLRHGLHAALNHLACTRAGAWLASWPASDHPHPEHGAD